MKTKKLVFCGLFTALIAVGAFIRIPIPYIPCTMQVLFTTTAALVLGPVYGALSSVVYMTLGLIGVPIFTEGGGFMYVLKPTFGYIIGFCVGAFVTGWIAKRGKSSVGRMLLASYAGMVFIYLFGLVYYYVISNYVLNVPIGVGTLMLYCFLMVVPGDIVFCAGGAYLTARLAPITRRYFNTAAERKKVADAGALTEENVPTDKQE